MFETLFSKSHACSYGSGVVLGLYLFYLISKKEEVVTRNQSLEKLKMEAEKCFVQSEKFCNEKEEFESAIYAKVCALNFLSLCYSFAT